MAHNIYSGLTASVSTTPQGANLLLAAFEALTYTPIAVDAVVTAPGMKSTRTGVGQVYMTGVEQTAAGHIKVDGGDLVVGNIADDPGILVMKGLFASGAVHAFKFTRTTTLVSGVSVVETAYTRGVVLSTGDGGGGADDVVLLTFTLAFNQLPILDLP